MTGAVFSDVEGTLVAGSVPGIFIKTGYKMGEFGRGKLALALFLNTLAKPFPAQSRANLGLRYAALNLLMRGKTLAQVERIIEGTVPVLLKAIKPASLAKLREAQAAGLPIVLVSAGLHQAIARLGQELGGRGEGTHMEMRGDIFTGRGDPPCQGEVKAERVKAVAREMEIDLAESVGYGDTASDGAFLSLLGKAVVVDPSSALEAEARRRSWEILHTANNADKKEV